MKPQELMAMAATTGLTTTIIIRTTVVTESTTVTITTIPIREMVLSQVEEIKVVPQITSNALLLIEKILDYGCITVIDLRFRLHQESVR
jgi:hypothetical protein